MIWRWRDGGNFLYGWLFHMSVFEFMNVCAAQSRRPSFADRQWVDRTSLLPGVTETCIFSIILLPVRAPRSLSRLLSSVNCFSSRVATEPTAARPDRTTMPPDESVRPELVEGVQTLQRMDGTTTMSHYVLERMHQQYSGKRLVLQLQSRLSQQQPREQVHFLLRVLPHAVKDEYEREREARGRLEGTPFYVGEIIGRHRPDTGLAGDTSNTGVIASQHEAWQALRTVCLQRRHGWETQHGPVRLGPRRKALREQLLQDVSTKPWESAVTEVASKLVICPRDLLTEVQQERGAEVPTTVDDAER